MKSLKNIILVTLKSNNNPLFTITCKDDRDISDDELKEAVKFHYDKYYGNVEVSIILEFGHFTDIKVTGKDLDLLLTWTFITNIVID